MSGLETILKEILTEAQEAAENQIAAATAEADTIIARAREKAAELSKDIIGKGQIEADKIRQQAHTSAKAEARNKLLACKQELISTTVDEARKKLESISDSEYVSVILELVKKYATAEKGTIHFNSRDLKRLPSNFNQLLAQNITDGELSLSDVPYDIDSGFILVYEGIDINCSFKAIFESVSDELCDSVNRLLFQSA